MMRISKQSKSERFWRLLESPLTTGLIGESTFDFYGGLINPALTLRRIIGGVQAVREETSSVKSFVLKPNGHFRGFAAGQHVNLTVEIEGVRHTRCYSPSNAPDGTGTITLTVRRHTGGRVSSWLHESLKPGDYVELGQAFGDFTLQARAAEKILFIAGGSGITPIASLLRDLCARGRARDVVVLCYDRTSAELIFAKDLVALARRYPGVRIHFAVTREIRANLGLTGHFSRAHLDCVAPDFAQRRTFVCGPPALVSNVHRLWMQRADPMLLKTETFALPEAVVSAHAAPVIFVRVNALRSARSFAADSGTPLLVQAERAGLSPKSGCRQGICLSCCCRKRIGTVRNLLTGVVSSEPDEDIRLCVSTPLSDVTLDL